MTRLRSWAPKGERLVDKVPHGRWKTATFPAALRNDRIDAPCLFDGPINGERFRAYVEQFLVPTLKPGDVVILDNLGSHKGKAVRRAIRTPGRASCFAEILARPQPDRAGPRQVQNPAAKGGRAKLRSRLPSLCSDSHPVSPRGMRRLHQERRLCVRPKTVRSRSRTHKSEPYSDCGEFDDGEIIGVVFFVAGRHRAEMFEFVEEAFDEISEAIEIGAEGGDFTRLGIGLMLPQAPWLARLFLRASLS